MSCNNGCNNCRNIKVVQDILVSKGNAVYFVLPPANIYNGERICFVIPSSLNIGVDILPIFINVGTHSYRWISRSGNSVYTDQVTNRRLYVGRLRTDAVACMNERCNLKSTRFNFPVLTVDEPTPFSESQLSKGGEEK